MYGGFFYQYQLGKPQSLLPKAPKLLRHSESFRVSLNLSTKMPPPPLPYAPRKGKREGYPGKVLFGLFFYENSEVVVASMLCWQTVATNFVPDFLFHKTSFIPFVRAPIVHTVCQYDHMSERIFKALPIKENMPSLYLPKQTFCLLHSYIMKP